MMVIPLHFIFAILAFFAVKLKINRKERDVRKEETQRNKGFFSYIIKTSLKSH